MPNEECRTALKKRRQQEGKHIPGDCWCGHNPPSRIDDPHWLRFIEPGNAYARSFIDCKECERELKELVTILARGASYTPMPG